MARAPASDKQSGNKRTGTGRTAAKPVAADTALRQAVIDTCLAMNDLGINQGTSGNVSVRSGDGFLVTPSGVSYHRLQPSSIVAMRFAGTDRPAGYLGDLLPSSEWRMHHDILAARTDAGAVIHTHAPWCTTLACLHREIPAFHYMVAVAGGNSIRCAPYATFGTQALSDHALAALENRSACLLANHGMICLGGDLDRTLKLAVEVETLARQYCQTLAVGRPAILDDAEMARVLERFRSYGRQPDDLGGTENAIEMPARLG